MQATSSDTEHQAQESAHETQKGVRGLPIVRKSVGLFKWAQTTRPFRTFSRFIDVAGPVLSGGMSYQALFAVFAGVWVGFGIISISLRDNMAFLEELTEQLNMFIPGLVGDNGAVSLNELLQGRSLDFTSLIAGVSLIWVALAWFTGTRRSVRIIFGLDVKQYKNAVLLKLRDFIGVIFFGLLILISASVTIVSTNLTDWAISLFDFPEDFWLLGTLGSLARYVAMFTVDLLILVAIHRILAEIKVPWRTLLFGCSIGALVLFGLKVLADVLFTGATSNPLLASFAVIVGLLIWFNLICRVLLLTSSWIATGLDPELGLPLDAESDDDDSDRHA